jgi:hypothetical protein
MVKSMANSISFWISGFTIGIEEVCVSTWRSMSPPNGQLPLIAINTIVRSSSMEDQPPAKEMKLRCFKLPQDMARYPKHHSRDLLGEI